MNSDFTKFSKLFFIPSRQEFLKIQPGTGDNLLREDIAEGYTDYVLWNTFSPLDLGLDGELEMECVDSGMVMLKGDSRLRGDDTGRGVQDDILKRVMEQAYGDGCLETIQLFS